MAIDQLRDMEPLYQMIQQALSQLLPQEPNLSGQLLQLLPLKKALKLYSHLCGKDAFIHICSLYDLKTILTVNQEINTIL